MDSWRRHRRAIVRLLAAGGAALVVSDASGEKNRAGCLRVYRTGTPENLAARGARRPGIKGNYDGVRHFAPQQASDCFRGASAAVPYLARIKSAPSKCLKTW